MITQSQKQFAEVMSKIETLRADSERSGKWEDAAAKSCDDLLKSADRLKIQVEMEAKAASLKEWGEQSQGSFVKSFSRPAGPTEGVVEGVDENGDPQTAQAEQALKTMASPNFHHAMNDYVKSTLRGRQMKSTSMKTLQETISSAGGDWTVPEFRPELIAKLPAPAGVAANVQRWTIGSDRMSFPKLVYNGLSTDDPRGDIYTMTSRFANGPEAPNSDYSEATNPIAGRTEVQVHTRILPVYISRAMVEDGQFDVMGYVSQKIAETNMLQQSYLFLNGTGVAQPQGILNCPDMTTGGSSGGMRIVSGVAAKLSWAGVASGSTGATDPTKGLVGLDAYLPPQYTNAKFYANKLTYAGARALVDGQNRPLWQSNDAYPNFRTGTPAQLFGYECVVDQFVPDIAASSTSVVLGDLRGYYVADRVTMGLEVLRETRALKDEYVLYARVRYGGALVEPWRVKVLTCAAS